MGNTDVKEIRNNLLNNKNKTILFGNISIKVRNEMILNKNSIIKSGDITIHCNDSMTIQHSSVMMALRNDLDINIKNVLKINKKTYSKLRAINGKNIKHSKLQFIV